jgi:hypothetical protein
MRGKLEVETLLQIILVLVVVWIGIQVVDALFDVLGSLVELLTSTVGIIIIALILLWWLDYI